MRATKTDAQAAEKDGKQLQKLEQPIREAKMVAIKKLGYFLAILPIRKLSY